MPLEPRIRVSAVLRWEGRVLLCRHEKSGRGEYWLLPGGGVNSGESLVEALRRELSEEVGIGDDITFEGPVAVVDSIAPKRLVTKASLLDEFEWMGEDHHRRHPSFARLPEDVFDFRPRACRVRRVRFRFRRRESRG